MADARFFSNAGPFTLEELAEISGAVAAGAQATGKQFLDVCPLDRASEFDVSFLDNKKYQDAFKSSGAGVCIARPEYEERAPDEMALLLTPDPYSAYAKVAAAFYPGPDIKQTISENALIHSTASIGKHCSIAGGVEIGPYVKIADGAVIGANTVISAGCEVGEGAQIYSNVSLQCCLIGDYVIIHPGVCIGQDGFGFAPGAGGHRKVPQLGRVIIGDQVEIGANTTIDRGTGPDTVIGDGTKIDNLVQIGHNVEIGSHCFIVAQVGVSGSSKIGDFTMVGGQTGIAGHLEIGSGVKIAAQSGIMRSIGDGETMGGSPARPMKTWMREIAMIQKMAKKKGQ